MRKLYVIREHLVMVKDCYPLVFCIQTCYKQLVMAYVYNGAVLSDVPLARSSLFCRQTYSYCQRYFTCSFCNRLMDYVRTCLFVFIMSGIG